MGWLKRRRCPHARQRGIYGDEINFAGGKRARCLDCGNLRDYGTPGQLGLEATPDEYVANMVGVFAKVRACQGIPEPMGRAVK